MRGLALALVVAAAGCAVDPCAGADGACLGMHLTGTATIDQIAVDLSGAVTYHHDWAVPAGAKLPLAVGVLLPQTANGAIRVDVVGLVSGVAVASGSAMKAITPGGEAEVYIPLHPVRGTCSDGVQNGNESGNDCGGIDCAKCGSGEKCGSSKDCVSGVCAIGRCT